MTFTPCQLIKIGRLFLENGLNTFEIKRVMRCDEQDVYHAMTAAREAYHANKATPPVDRKTQKAEAITRWTGRNKAVNAELRREARA